MAFRLFTELGGEWEVEPESKNIIGFSVFDKDGNNIGEIQDLLVDTENNNAINYALAGKGWIASMLGVKQVIVPLRKIDIDQADRSVHFDVVRDDLSSFPDYASIRDPDLKQKVDSFWGMEAYRRPMEGGERLGRPMTIAVTEERAKVTREMTEAGEVDIVMQEEVESRPITEEVHGERVDIERHKVDDRPLSEFEQDRMMKPGETISIPVTEERIRITKEPVVVEEITVRRTPTTRQVTMEEELHKEHVEIEEHKPGEHAA
ncbi:MAG: PRC and DUF2382 domain-containing protein [Rubrobacteridae bacterium]|nr:PRC and DUF2382 domain-containing protein [Rubrobacteridae bacterium]